MKTDKELWKEESYHFHIKRGVPVPCPNSPLDPLHIPLDHLGPSRRPLRFLI